MGCGKKVIRDGQREIKHEISVTWDAVSNTVKMQSNQ